MNEEHAKYLDTFPNWLRSLGEDAEVLAQALSQPELGENAREAAASGINYLFKSLDLIPDGIDDIGYLDDAFVLRVSADMATAAKAPEADDANLGQLTDLSGDCDLIREFLGDNYERLETYVKGLKRGAARGRTVSEIVSDARVCEELISDVRGFTQSYEAPTFAREEKNLIKLRAFFDAKLPK